MNRKTSIYLKTAYPVVAELLLVNLMTTMDTLMVSSLGTVAISAVGLNLQPRLILQMPAEALNIGVMTVTGMHKGAGEKERANRLLKTSLLLSLAISSVVFLLSRIIATPLFRLLGATAETLAPGVDYFHYIAIGNIFQCISLTVTAAQRGIGKTKISFTTNLSANLINVFLNYCLIGGHLGFPALGIKGAAIATMIGSIAAMVIALLSSCRPKEFLFLPGRSGMEKLSNLSFMLKVARGGFLERTGLRIGLLLFSMECAYLGTIAHAAYTIGQRFTSLSFNLGDGFGIAASALVAQSIGAKTPEDAKEYGYISLRIAACVALTYSIILFFGKEFLVGLFTSDPEVFSLATTGLQFIIVIASLQLLQTLMMSTLRGAGDVRYLAIVTMIGSMIVRPLLGYVLAYPLGLGSAGIYLAFISDALIRLILSVRRFRSGKWLLIANSFHTSQQAGETE